MDQNPTQKYLQRGYCLVYNDRFPITTFGNDAGRESSGNDTEEIRGKTPNKEIFPAASRAGGISCACF